LSHKALGEHLANLSLIGGVNAPPPPPPPPSSPSPLYNIFLHTPIIGHIGLPLSWCVMTRESISIRELDGGEQISARRRQGSAGRVNWLNQTKT